jgi:hypothetical protein
MNSKGVFKVGLSLFKYTRNNQIIVLDGDLNKLANIALYSNDKNVLISTTLKSGGRNDSDDIIDNFGNWVTQGDRRLLNELRISKWVIWNQPVEGGPTYTTKGYNFYLKQRGQKHSWLGWKNYSTVYLFKNPFFRCGSGPTASPLYSNGGTSAEISPDCNWNIYAYEIYPTYSGGADLNYLPTPLFSLQADVSFRGFDGILYPILHKEHAVFP